MNFLQLVQRTRQECGIAGLGPATVVAQVNEAKRLVEYVQQAWIEIQNLHDDWLFMRGSFSAPVPQSTDALTPAAMGLTDWGAWRTDTFRMYRTADGISDEQWLVEWDYDVLRDTYRFGPQVEGRPMVFGVRPHDKAIVFGPRPETAYTIVGDYQRRPVTLAADADVPAIAERHHMIIVYKAMESYALFEAATEVLTRARDGFARGMTALEREELEPIRLGRPLA